MEVMVKTVSGDTLVSSNVSEARILWRYNSEQDVMTIEKFKKEFLLYKQDFLSISFDGSQHIFIDGDNVDYITAS